MKKNYKKFIVNYQKVVKFTGKPKYIKHFYKKIICKSLKNISTKIEKNCKFRSGYT